MTRVALMATYPPRRCGIATFAADLRTALVEHPGPALDVSVVALDRDGDNPSSYPPEVSHRLHGADVDGHRRLARRLSEEADVILLQHEFGIYGGPWGRRVLDFVDEVRIPVVTTLHTVLAEPGPEARAILAGLRDGSERLVVMSPRGRQILLEQLGARAERVEHIHHGVPEIPRVEASDMRRRLGMRDVPTLVSFGLLGPGKRLELAITAFAEVASWIPDAQFVIVGVTHPEVRRRSGEAYRRQLQAMANDLGVGERTIFVDRFLERDELIRLLQASDVFVTAYANAEQVTSGALSVALAAGRACVSTPYVHARELLGQGRGSLVPFEDPAALAGAIGNLLSDPAARREMAERSRSLARHMAWPVVAASYRRVIDEVLAERSASRARPRLLQGGAAAVPPVRRHLDRLRAPHGIWQHTVGAAPDPRHGTCTDDVARALIVDLAHARVDPQPGTMAAVRADLRYLGEAFDATSGRFRNLRADDGAWLERVGSEDAHGRAVQALGFAVEHSEDRSVVGAAHRLFEAALPAALGFAWLRPGCYVILGCASVVRQGGAAEGAARRVLEALGERVFSDLSETTEEWPWPEPTVTYETGVVPQALIEAGASLSRPDMVAAGIRTLDWLLEAQTAAEGHLRPIGNRGWWRRGGPRARYDQQPIEAASLVAAADAARRASGDARWMGVMDRAFGWFLGANDLGLAVADPSLGVCGDGLSPTGVSDNRGAESTLVWLTAVEIMRAARRPAGQSQALRARSDGRASRLHPVPRRGAAEVLEDPVDAGDRDADRGVRRAVVDS
jgi:glycosyltransferase involved in cell wall biosynthesis